MRSKTQQIAHEVLKPKFTFRFKGGAEFRDMAASLIGERNVEMIGFDLLIWSTLEDANSFSELIAEDYPALSFKMI